MGTKACQLKGHGHLVAMATRMAVDGLALKAGVPMFALIKTVALDRRSTASNGAGTAGRATTANAGDRLSGFSSESCR
ncbi:MAG TPA: TOBE domain-containing protein, partial [Xanthobacteraceae bacterium]|nr:TOBE domain-containing protein [Xanthobacteraceae bacterium]